MSGDTFIAPRAQGGVHVGAVLNELYMVDALIGSGGMGDVFRGHTVDTGDDVAIKTIRPDLTDDGTIVELFLKEASVLRAIHHEAIVRYFVFSAGKSIGQPYIAMEYVSGEPLTDVIRRGPSRFEDVVTLLRRLSTGLQVAHSCGIIHRDLSPDNIVLPGGRFEQAKIIDFGIARLLQSGKTLIGQTFAGKPAYASPEQLGLFGGNVAERSDVYSLGLVVAEVALGRPVGIAANVLQTIEMRRRVPDLDGLDPRLRPLLERMLAPDPEGRPASMAEVAAWGPDETIRPAPRVSRKVLALFGLAVFGVALLVVPSLWLAPPKPPPPPSAGRQAGGQADRPFDVAFGERMRVLLPTLSAAALADRVSNYLAAREHKAQAISFQPPGAWRTTGRDSRDVVAEKALEGCQAFFGNPCALVAVDTGLEPLPADGTDPPRRDMPRIRYEGNFDPERIPSAVSLSSQPSDVRAYRAAPGPKAAAFHPRGLVFTSTAASAQRDAEGAALAACNNDPARKGSDGPCYLYAVGDQVVLPRRAIEPLTAAAERPTEASRLETQLSAWIAGALPDISASDRQARAQNYAAASGNKAQALLPGTTRSWYVADRASAAIAEEKVLEGCQVFVGQPCVLAAVNDLVQPFPVDRNWLRRDMPRTRYAGRFDLERVPALLDGFRRRPEVAGYGTAAGPKAAAYHPWGRLFIATGAATEAEAETRALADCNADPDRRGRNGPCYVYSRGDQVVLPDRRVSAVAK